MAVGLPPAELLRLARAARKPPTPWEALQLVDARLAATGVFPISPWWRAELAAFYGGPAQLLVEMVGRGGDKSRTSVKMALAETLHGDFLVPKGEVHYFTHISESVDEAEKTLGILVQYLTALGESFRTRGRGTIELDRLPRGFKVLACRVGAVSGWRCIGWTADECAKWNNEGSDPSAEVITSIRAMTVTHAARARGRMLSSPLGRLGFFFDEWAGGTTPDRHVGQAPTWVANPSVTEAATRKLEPVPSKWAREYAAVPMEGDEESLLSAAMLDASTRPRHGVPAREPGVSYVAAMDPGFTRNAWTFVIAARRWVDGRVRRSIVFAKEWRGTPDKPLQSRWVLTQIAQVCRSYGVEVVWTDQYERFGLNERGQEEGIGLTVVVPEKWAQGDQYAAWEAVERWASDAELDLPADQQLRADLLGVHRKLTPSGITIRLMDTPDGRHCDYAPAVLLALSRAIVEPAAGTAHKPGTPEAWKAKEDALEQAIDAEMDADEAEERYQRWGAG